MVCCQLDTVGDRIHEVLAAFVMDANVFLAFLSAALAGMVALWVSKSARGSIVEWAFAAGMAVFAAENLFAGVTAMVTLPEEKVYWQTWQILVGSLLPGIWLFFSLGYARGNSRTFLSRWRLPLVAALLLPPGLAAASRRGLIQSLHRPWHTAPVFGLGAAGLILYLVSLLCAVAVLMQLERTFRAAAGNARWRIKYRILGLGAVFGVRVYFCGRILLFGALDPALQSVEAGTLIAACFLIAHSLSRSVDRDVEVYPSYSVLLNSFTAVLAGSYLILIAVLAKVMDRFTGDENFVPAAILVVLALVVLGALWLSDRVRSVIKRFVGRHFQRPKYDYRAIWETFREVTARQVAQPDLCRAVVKVVSDLFQAMSVTLWLVKEDKTGLVFGASTTLSRKEAQRLKLQPDQTTALIRAVEGHAAPFDLQSTEGDWELLLKGLHPDDLNIGGGGICAPLLVRRELLGFLTIGHRFGETTYSTQDLDLLVSVSNEVAVSLHGLQLMEDLTHAKQLEAFQTMSAFVAHDLKNTSFKLALLLENLPTHFDNPAFRQDALQGISQAVSHLNLLIAHLRPLRNELEPKIVESDLNEIVIEALKGFRQAPRGELVKDLQPLPKVKVDPDQMRKVVTNLLLNARDAIGAHGTIRVETRLRARQAVLTVIDTGCGMTSEFIDGLLFRPFQTTKENGMGIGMFQCKKIVDAHQGKIEVESQPGKGTVFRVVLPLSQVSHEPKTIRAPATGVLAGR